MWDPIKQKPIGAAEVKEKFGVGPGESGRRPGAVRRQRRQRAGRAGHRRQDGGRADQPVRRSRNPCCARAGEIKQPKRRQALIDFAEQARISKKLVQLDDHVPLHGPLDDLAVKPLDRGKLTHFLREQGFRTLLNRVESKLGNAAAGQAETLASLAPRGQSKGHGSGGSAGAVRGAWTLGAGREALRADPGCGDARSLDRGGARARLRRGQRRDRRPDDHARAELVGVALALAPGHAGYIPLGHYIAEGPDALALAAQTKGHEADPAARGAGASSSRCSKTPAS